MEKKKKKRGMFSLIRLLPEDMVQLSFQIIFKYG